VRTAHSGHESAQRRLREEEANAARAQEAVMRYDEELASIAIQEESAKAAEGTLRASPEKANAIDVVSPLVEEAKH